ncbi:MAG TPA: thiamine pyrophosphate-dependent enzyme [Polyangiaceae bacterium]|nr:thiamine pyrophosphate-dependent enzyme [Polyangiaceae bacterium]
MPLPSTEIIRAMREDGSLAPEYDPHLTNDEVTRLYRAMVETRYLDERLTALQRQGRIGFHVGSLGEEGAIIGAAFATRKQDWLFPCYREFGAALLRGLDFQRFIDNMFGNANDTVKGRQMPDHYTCKAAHWLSISSPVGTQITQAVGFAWAAKLKKDDLATLVYFGDGATSSSDFHSGMNFAGVFKVPVVFFCRNNGWAISVPAERQTASETFAIKGVAYGIPAVRVDGNDVFAVVHAVRKAIERGSRGEGPTLIEALTYRMGGHSTSDDPNAYRASDALKAWADRDPIQRVQHYMRKVLGWTDDRDREIRDDVDRKFRAAVEIAEKAPKPALETLVEDVYASPPWHLVEQREALLAGPRPNEHHG